MFDSVMGMIALLFFAALFFTITTGDILSWAVVGFVVYCICNVGSGMSR